MDERSPIREFRYVGPLAELCRGFIAEKRGLGYIYTTEAKHLSEFSRFSESFDTPPNTLTEELVNAWIERRPTDSDRNYYSRFALIKLFAEYMRRLGHDAHCLTKQELGKIQWSYTPYIFTHDEIRSFFVATDSLKRQKNTMAPRRHIVMPMLFRLLYCCGLRATEALTLRNEDADLENGILTIRESKFEKTRYVPMAEPLWLQMKEYALKEPSDVCPKDYFFRAPDDGHYGTKGLYCVFRECLWNAGISHGGRGKGPRVHDFRHTFAVHCLDRWAREGKDVSTALPRLSAYLGHKDLAATERYLRMTAEVYPEISATLSEKYGAIIPKDGDTV